MGEEAIEIDEKEFFACRGSIQFAKEMASASPFQSLDQAVSAARHIWLNQVDVNGWLEALSVPLQIGQCPSTHPKLDAISVQWSKGEQSTASATATDSASQRRYSNRPIVEFENAAEEQMIITELRLEKLFLAKASGSTSNQYPAVSNEAERDRESTFGGHLTVTQIRPAITIHVLDVSKGCPASGVEVCLEMWKGMQRPLFRETNTSGWVFMGSSATDKDRRSGQLMSMVEDLKPGS